MPHASTYGNGDGHVFSDGVSTDASMTSDADSPMFNLLAVATIVLRQALDFVNDSLTSDEQLTFQSTYIPGSTIGKHLRHARDHFSLLLDGPSPLNTSNFTSTSPLKPYEVSYDTRTRNTPMEREREAAREAIEQCIRRLEEVVPTVGVDDEVSLSAVTPHLQTFKTTFGRELWFAALHAVHHWSMVRVIAGEQGITLEDSFGVAPSTLVYHGSQAPLGKSKM